MLLELTGNAKPTLLILRKLPVLLECTIMKITSSLLKTKWNTSKFLQKHTPTHACLAFSLLLLWESLQYVVMTIPMKQHVNGRFFILLILFPIVCNVYQITWALNDHEDCYRLPVLTDWERYVKHNDEAQEINRTLNMNHKRRSRGTLTMKK